MRTIDLWQRPDLYERRWLAELAEKSDIAWLLEQAGPRRRNDPLLAAVQAAA